MMSEADVLATVFRLLDETSIPYMLTGSVAASYHGRPRATHDADIVIDPTADQLETLVTALLDAGFYVDRERARQALRDRRPFNVIETHVASKVDLIVRRDRPFSEQEFARRLSAELQLGRPVSIVTAEDAILSKLEWARLAGDSERQLADAAGIVAVNPNLDRAYLDHWADQLGVLDLWRRLAGS